MRAAIRAVAWMEILLNHVKLHLRGNTEDLFFFFKYQLCSLLIEVYQFETCIIHADEKTFIYFLLDLCGLHFVVDDGLKSSLRTHDLIKPFKCDFG